MSLHSWKVRSLVIFRFLREETRSIWRQFRGGLFSRRPGAKGQRRVTTAWKPALGFLCFLLAVGSLPDTDKVTPAGGGSRCLASVLSHPSCLFSGTWVAFSAELSFTTWSFGRYKFLAPNPSASDAIGLRQGPGRCTCKELPSDIKGAGPGMHKVKAIRDSRGWMIKC